MQWAKRQCLACPVREKCLIEGVNFKESYGIRGGYSMSRVMRKLNAGMSLRSLLENNPLKQRTEE